MSAPRVLHVAQPVEAGVAVVVRQLVEHQLELGWQVAVACPPTGSLPGWVRAAGANVLPWPALRSPGRSTVTEVRALRRAVVQWAPDVVHLHSSKAGLAGRLAVRGTIPTLYQPHAWSFSAVHGLLRAVSVRWERLAGRWTDVFVCVSADEQTVGRQHDIRGRYALCPNGIDLTRFRPVGDRQRAAARARLGLPDSPLVICVGRLCEQKGQDVLLAAWEQLRTSGRMLALVGDGPDRAALERRAGPDVLFVGDTSDVTSWYEAATFLAQPSRWEGASLTTREALASGLGVIATDVGGVRTLLDGAGTIVPIDDVDALAAAISRRLDDRDLVAREALRAREIAERDADLQGTLHTMDALYASVLCDRSDVAQGQAESIHRP